MSSRGRMLHSPSCSRTVICWFFSAAATDTAGLRLVQPTLPGTWKLGMTASTFMNSAPSPVMCPKCPGIIDGVPFTCS